MKSHRTVTYNGWEFFVEERPDGGSVRVPDCGGQADGHPREPAQLAWAETAFAGLPGFVRVWPTVWEVSPDALPGLDALLRRAG